MHLNKILGVIAIYAISPFALSNVQVTVEQQTISFNTSVRLDSVLSAVTDNRKIYWPASALYIKDDGVLEQKRSATLKKLALLQNKANEEQRAQLKQLAVEIRSWQIAKRLPVIINYDLARLFQDENPLLQSGEYILTLPKRGESIYIFGALSNGAKVVSHKNASSVQSYLKELRFYSEDPNHVIIIQADARVLPIDLYNSTQRYLEVQPGGVIFVPFKSGWFEHDIVELNQLLMELVVNRVQP